MQRFLLKSKIHMATVTEANVNYEGSITIDQDLMEAAGLLEGEKVLVVDNTNGHRLETYVIKGKRKSGIVCMNGGSARLIQVGDKITVMAFTLAEQKVLPRKVVVDGNNRVVDKK